MNETAIAPRKHTSFGITRKLASECGIDPVQQLHQPHPRGFVVVVQL